MTAIEADFPEIVYPLIHYLKEVVKPSFPYIYYATLASRFASSGRIASATHRPYGVGRSLAYVHPRGLVIFALCAAPASHSRRYASLAACEL